MDLIDTKTYSTLHKALAPHSEGGLINAVNARDLHNCLGVGRDFSTWIKQRIAKYSFVENIDYITLTKTGELDSTGLQTAIDYFIAPDMAKQIAMVQNNEIGKQVRLYYIQLENKQLEKEAQAKVRADMRLDFLPMTDAVVVSREGKTVESHHFSNECDLINRIVLGATAKHYRKMFDIDETEPLRDLLSTEQQKAVLLLQRANTVYLMEGLDFQERKTKLQALHTKRSLKPLLIEVIREA